MGNVEVAYYASSTFFGKLMKIMLFKTNYTKNYASSCNLSKPIYGKAKPEKETWHHVNYARKETLIRPVLNWKKPYLDKDNFTNYRPVANIPIYQYTYDSAFTEIKRDAKV